MEEIHSLFLIIASSEYRSEAIPVYGRDEEHACARAGDWLAVRRRALLTNITVIPCSGGFLFDPRVAYPQVGTIAFAGQFTREIAERMRVRE